jgi:spore coat protein CotF
MKKHFALIPFFFLLMVSISYSQTNQESDDEQENIAKKQNRVQDRAYLYSKNRCEPCKDKLLLKLEAKDSLASDEKMVYALLKQNCEICIASMNQVAAIQNQTDVIDNKANPATPLWLVIIASICVAIVTIIQLP